ncbi:MAG: hypothetical protein ACXVCP_07855 [Bdellovibrio sp.]
MNVGGWIKFFLLFFLLHENLWADCNQHKIFADEGKKYFVQEQYLLASIQFKLASQFSCIEEDNNKALYSYLLSMQRLGEKQEVLDTLEGLEKKASAEIKSNVALFKTVELHLPVSNQLTSDQKRRVNIWDIRNVHFEGEKKPWVAGTLSAVLPGAGQAYVGAWSSAFYSLILNGLFLATTLEFQREGLYAASLTSGLVFSVTYFGGILSSVQSARLYNESVMKPQEEKEYQELFPELKP